MQNYNITCRFLWVLNVVSLTLSKKRKLRMSESGVFRMVEVTGEWRKLHNEELNDLYCSQNTVRVMWGM